MFLKNAALHGENVVHQTRLCARPLNVDAPAAERVQGVITVGATAVFVQMARLTLTGTRASFGPTTFFKKEIKFQ